MVNQILVGDIGGTNSRLLLYQINVASDFAPGNKNRPNCTLKFKKTFQNENYPTFNSVVAEFLTTAECTSPPITACFAVAGPVENNFVQFTNRSLWVMEGEQIAITFNIREVILVNDFEANGYGLLTLNEETECKVLQNAKRNPTAPIACIGAGTGLGQCFLTPDGSGNYSCFPSEGGHAEFAPRNELESNLLLYLKEKFGQKHRVSVERVVSGTGLANVYEFLCTKMPDKIDADVHKKYLEAGDQKGAVIAHNQQCEICRETMKIFVTAYGAEAGVAALKFLPYGGLYLTGGLTQKNIDLISAGPFMEAFADKGRVSKLLDNVPVIAVLIDDLGTRLFKIYSILPCFVIFRIFFCRGAEFLAYNLYHRLISNPSTRRFSATTPLAADLSNDSIKRVLGVWIPLTIASTACVTALACFIMFKPR